jgi:hypothetical protein
VAITGEITNKTNSILSVIYKGNYLSGTPFVSFTIVNFWRLFQKENMANWALGNKHICVHEKRTARNSRWHYVPMIIFELNFRLIHRHFGLFFIFRENIAKMV